MALLGFLLILPFTAAFARFSHGQRGLFVTGLVLAAAATAVLLAPDAWQVVLARRRQQDCGSRSAGVTTVLGLAAMSLAASAAVVLVLSYARGRGA